MTAAAERLHPDSEGRGMLRWCQAAGHLIERPAESIPHNRPDILGPLERQETATLFTAATADDLDWRALSRLATPQWWDEWRPSTLATATGRAPALCLLARWHEALDLLARTEPVRTTEARARANPACFRDAATYPRRLRVSKNADVGRTKSFTATCSANVQREQQGKPPRGLPEHTR
ncbi:hypothetical protein [Streptomyces sp. NPDC056660]|uniref:hypothetical protein n=1 Tax=Streptomyces sp. NPDC056660 TaxID=3345897 RepID=UPI003673B4A9